MNLHKLNPFTETKRTRKRIGRGSGSGWGCTSGRGNKGQNSRSGGGVRPGFEGGQMPLQRRLPKRGFTNIFSRTYISINLDQLLAKIVGKLHITLEDIYANRLAKKGALVKILGRGEVATAIYIEAHRFSIAAVEKITKSGGKVKILLNLDQTSK